MGRLNILLIVLLVGTCSCHGTSVPVKNVPVRPGDNITLYCDCKTSTGVYISWFKKCSHENQPTLVINISELAKDKFSFTTKRFARFELVKNDSSASFDMLIINFTKSDEGLYYCGTTEMTIKKTGINIYKYSNTSTRLLINSSGPHSGNKTPLQDCRVCWKLLFSVCPVLFVLSGALSLLTIYLCCHKTEKTCQDDQRKHEEVQIHQASQKVKRKRTIQSSDYAVYSAINKSKAKGDSNFA